MFQRSGLTPEKHVLLALELAEEDLGDFVDLLNEYHTEFAGDVEASGHV